MAEAIRKFTNHVRRRSSGGSSGGLAPPPPPPKDLEALYKMSSATAPSAPPPEATAPELLPPPPPALEWGALASPHVPHEHLPAYAPALPIAPSMYPKIVMPPSPPTAVGVAPSAHEHEHLIRSSPVVPESRKVPAKVETQAGADVMMLAAFHADLETVKAQIASGYKLKTRNRYGESVMHLAASSQGADILKVITELQRAGVSVNDRDHLQRTPLHVAALVGNGGAVKKLCLLDADANARDLQGRSALHVAVANGHRQSTMQLLYNDADPNAQDKEGMTPLMLAAKLGHVSIAKLLVTYGADASLVNRSGLAAVDLSREFKQKHMEAVLCDPELFKTLPDDAATSPVNEAVARPPPQEEERRDPLRFTTAELPADDGDLGEQQPAVQQTEGDMQAQAQQWWDQQYGYDPHSAAGAEQQDGGLPVPLASPSAVAEGQWWTEEQVGGTEEQLASA